MSGFGLTWTSRAQGLGDFVLSGGELAAACLIGAAARLIPGVLGNWDSTHVESHSTEALSTRTTHSRQAMRGSLCPTCCAAVIMARSRFGATSSPWRRRSSASGPIRSLRSPKGRGVSSRLAVLLAALLWSTSGLFIKSPELLAVAPAERAGPLIALWRGVLCRAAAAFRALANAQVRVGADQLVPKLLTHEHLLHHRHDAPRRWRRYLSAIHGAILGAFDQLGVAPGGDPQTLTGCARCGDARRLDDRGFGLRCKGTGLVCAWRWSQGLATAA